MNLLLENIVLEPVVCDQVIVPAENRYYDASMQFLKTSGRDTKAPTFDIDMIMTQYRANLSDVMRMTLPSLFFSKFRGPQPHVPTLWEMGGLNRGGYGRPSWCVIVGSATGGRVGRHGVCQVRYPTPDKITHPAGRHALVTAESETMFIIARTVGATTTCLVYKVDDVLAWPVLDGFPDNPDRPYVALNTALVAIREITGDKAKGWVDTKRLNSEAQQGVNRLIRMAQEKLQTAAMSACNIELFWDAAANSTDHNVHAVPVDTDVTTYKPDADGFVAEIIGRIGDYRKILNGTTLPSRAHPIPASVHYQPGDEGGVQIDIEIPSVLDDHPHVGITTTIIGDLPASLVAEAALSWGCTTSDELLAKIGAHPIVARNIFTHC